MGTWTMRAEHRDAVSFPTQEGSSLRLGLHPQVQARLSALHVWVRIPRNVWINGINGNRSAVQNCRDMCVTWETGRGKSVGKSLGHVF